MIIFSLPAQHSPKRVRSTSTQAANPKVGASTAPAPTPLSWIVLAPAAVTLTEAAKECQRSSP